MSETYRWVPHLTAWRHPFVSFGQIGQVKFRQGPPYPALILEKWVSISFSMQSRDHASLAHSIWLHFQASAVCEKQCKIKLGHMLHAVQNSIGAKLPTQGFFRPWKKVLMNPHLMEFLWNSLQWSRYAILAMPKALKKPAAVTATAPPGRSRSCDDFDGLRDAMQPWVSKMNFITYTSEKKIAAKDVKKLQVYLPHLKRIQRVHRTWNFSLSLIDQVLQQLNQVRVVQIRTNSNCFSID